MVSVGQGSRLGTVREPRSVTPVKPVLEDSEAGDRNHLMALSSECLKTDAGFGQSANLWPVRAAWLPHSTVAEFQE